MATKRHAKAKAKAKAKAPAGQPEHEAHEPEKPDIPLPEAGDHVRLADVDNSPKMLVEGRYASHGLDVRCRWFDTTGRLHEETFHAGDLVSAEEDTDGACFAVPPNVPVPGHGGMPLSGYPGASAAPSEQATSGTSGPTSTTGASGPAGAETLSGEGKAAAQATHKAETTPHGSTHPSKPHGK